MTNYLIFFFVRHNQSIDAMHTTRHDTTHATAAFVASIIFCSLYLSLSLSLSLSFGVSVSRRSNFAIRSVIPVYSSQIFFQTNFSKNLTQHIQRYQQKVTITHTHTLTQIAHERNTVGRDDENKTMAFKRGGKRDGVFLSYFCFPLSLSLSLCHFPFLKKGGINELRSKRTRTMSRRMKSNDVSYL